MRRLADQRCFNHPSREAAARCPNCGRFYCRECVTEHDQRLLCASCLRRVSAPGAKRGRRFASLARAFAALVGLMTLWLFFHLLGALLISLPSSFHEGTLWQQPWLDEP